ncbi:MAG TPA: hypothetical protein ENK23_00820 [Sorangium sp.]|nr:hypothetical protein [Sorangium sp.]
MAYLKQAVAGGVGYAVAGPAGALLGVALAGGDSDDAGYDMSDIPIGVHVEEQHQNDELGRRWSLHFLSEIPAPAFARVQFRNDSGQPLGGHAPFADAGGTFLAAAPIGRHNDGWRSVLYLPFGALQYTSPKHISLEVSVWSQQRGKLHPAGKGTLEANLPAATTWQPAAFLQPLVSLGARVMMTSGQPTQSQLATMVEYIASEFGILGPVRASALSAMLVHANHPPPLRDTIERARFRFPNLNHTAVVALLSEACFSDDHNATAARAALSDIATSLTEPRPQ